MRRPLPAHVHERFRPLDGHAIALVRPYVLVHERRMEQWRQRERRTALAIDVMAIGYEFPLNDGRVLCTT